MFKMVELFREVHFETEYIIVHSEVIRPCALLNKNNDIALSLFFKMGNE